MKGVWVSGFTTCPAVQHTLWLTKTRLTFAEPACVCGPGCVYIYEVAVLMQG